MKKQVSLHALFVAMGVLGGCTSVLGIEDLPERIPDAGAAPDALVLFSVGGVAHGVTSPLRLLLNHRSGSEVLDVVEDGSFSFPIEMRVGDPYEVGFIGAPPCVLEQATGVITDADPEITLVCEGVVYLNSLELVGPVVSALTLDSARLDYDADVPLLQSSVSVLATSVYSEATVAVAGIAQVGTVISPPLPLDLGENLIELVVSYPGFTSRTYRVTVRRAADVVQTTYAKASNSGASDIFGYSVAVSGDTLAVGAWGEASLAVGVDGDQNDDTAEYSGAVYVFRWSGTNWTQEAYLKASNTDSLDEFGYSVALSGDALAVGAPSEASATTSIDGDQTDDSASASGAVYVFRRSGTDWVQEAYLKASNTGTGDEFGTSIALSGDTLAVGAPGEDSATTGVDGGQDDSAPESGAVYVFRRSETAWAQEAYLKASNTGNSDEFGTSVALSGDALAVGAPGEASAATVIDGDQEDDAANGSGAVYVFRRSGTNWAQEAYVKASNTGASDGFGTSVALSGDALAVGAPGEASAATGTDGGDQADDTAASSGAVYVFRRGDTNWTQEAYLKAFNTDAGDEFGGSVAVSGDFLAVGASKEDSAAVGIDGDETSNAESSSGAVYLFQRNETSWAQEAYIKASNTEALDEFGSSVTLSSGILAIGAIREDGSATGIDGDQTDDSAADSGAVYIFH
ncbi:cadherin-like beta sandwich domain-containing protein [Haliangium sp.]|uniref:cadherin-like beta sandwich domain-containing protein n=1 Tax=Haliangium sp. TaxID=2663208 RepID=UPI003D0BFC5F